ncbi:MAG: metallophosphoesterase, partial [Gammaproteobacteria bacterium]|nr:metallophosphoesterase [Gammaproteobacteria bacterium]
MKYDIIGDIHGCHQSLRGLLENLGYQNTSAGYCHPSRQVIFLGDFIDRGPGQREVLDIVRPMVASGAALAVMGNHEFNAIAYHEKDPATGEHLRPHTNKNSRQHQAFLDCYADDVNAHADVIAWFKTLPLWLDLGDIRVIHACWDIAWIQ